jgi:xylan 1,4-beta-xylosidase
MGAVTWAFEFENQPWFYGFRDLATNGVDKPVLNVFRMFGKMQGDFVESNSDHAYTLQMALDSSFRGTKTDIGTLATKNKNTASVMVWNYHDVEKNGVATIADNPANFSARKSRPIGHGESAKKINDYKRCIKNRN